MKNPADKPVNTPVNTPETLNSSGPSLANGLATGAVSDKATPLRCFTGTLTAGTFSLLAYRLMLSIATNFANHPVTSSNTAVVNISAAVRTLVIGIVALGAGVFGIAALGLAALGIQLLFKKQPNGSEEGTSETSE